MSGCVAPVAAAWRLQVRVGQWLCPPERFGHRLRIRESTTNKAHTNKSDTCLVSASCMCCGLVVACDVPVLTGWRALLPTSSLGMVYFWYGIGVVCFRSVRAFVGVVLEWHFGV